MVTSVALELTFCLYCRPKETRKSYYTRSMESWSKKYNWYL